MTIKIYNVLTRQKEAFRPIQEGRVNIYVCGPTVYDYSHIGHAKTYGNFDVIVRYLRYRGYDVLYVQNITDVGHLLDSGEDRILRKARQTQSTPMQIVERYTKLYFDNMDALGVQRPDISPRASGHIPEQIEMIQQLLREEHAYVVNGSVYFDVSSYPEYGKLSGRRVEDQEEGTREAVRSEKNHPADFALWKKAEPEHIMRWNSPWGEGFPGWHIECSAMARKYLGETFDIHGGGIDNIFPHNECEIAQSECAHHGATFANYWMLVGSLTLDGVKMSKSLGNTLTLAEALERWRPEAIRAFILSSHYSNPIDFSDVAVESAEKGWQRIWGAVSLVRNRLHDAPDGEVDADILTWLETYKAAFIEKMDDDFNAPAAIGVLQEMTRKVNSTLAENAALSSGTLTAIDQIYRELGGDVLGIVPDSAEAGSADAEREAGLIRVLIDIRAAARANRDWATSDRIRDRLAELGVTLKDGKDGTTWTVS
ncbi:MAG: cysteine--tRNA ligase [Anaerolineae bacterium]|nr:cysteine--tRNA ligase [Anaerolineae bacterium]